MNFNNIELLLSNIGNLPSKANKSNSQVTTGFDRILDNIKRKFENFENNINSIDRKNLPEAVKKEFLNNLEMIEQALETLISNEEKISLSKEESLINISDVVNANNEGLPIAESNLLKGNSPIANVIGDIKGVIENVKGNFVNVGEQPASLEGKGILQNIYMKLDDIKSKIADSAELTNEDNLQPIGQKNVIQNVKTAIDNTLEKLASVINQEAAKGRENAIRLRHEESNLLPIFEQFNNRLDKNVSPLQENITGRHINRRAEDLAVKNTLINTLFDGDVKKILLSLLNNETTVDNYVKSAAESSNYNFINPNKVDLAFKETFLENKKDKENIDSVKEKTGNVEKNGMNKTEEYRLIKEVNAKDKDQQINKEINSTNKSQNIEVANKDAKALNYRIDYITIDAAKSGKSLINNISEDLQNSQTVKEVTNKLMDYIKFIKQEHIAKAELRLNIEDMGKLKILFTDVGDKINAKIYTENDNVKHFVSMAFDNIKENLVQKGINLSQYDFYHLNKDNQENHSEQNNQKNKNSYSKKVIENIKEQQLHINALYA